jgi:transposase InsO family protein
MVVLRLVFKLRWPNSSCFIERSSICVSRYGLLHQIDGGRPDEEHIIHRFGIPQTLTTDQGSSFMSHQVRDFPESLKMKLLSSLPYYSQANGQAESSNKILVKLIKKKIEENPNRWYEFLSEGLWAHHISKHSATKVCHSRP